MSQADPKVLDRVRAHRVLNGEVGTSSEKFLHSAEGLIEAPVTKCSRISDKNPNEGPPEALRLPS